MANIVNRSSNLWGSGLTVGQWVVALIGAVIIGLALAAVDVSGFVTIIVIFAYVILGGSIIRSRLGRAQHRHIPSLGFSLLEIDQANIV